MLPFFPITSFPALLKVLSSCLLLFDFRLLFVASLDGGIGRRFPSLCEQYGTFGASGRGGNGGLLRPRSGDFDFAYFTLKSFVFAKPADSAVTIHSPLAAAMSSNFGGWLCGISQSSSCPYFQKSYSSCGIASVCAIPTGFDGGGVLISAEGIESSEDFDALVRRLCKHY